MTETYDVIVVGARCAGAPTAMLAARLGHRVLLLERTRFPKDTVSTHLIHQPGVALLAKWNVLDAVVATGCPAIDRAGYRVAGICLDGSSEPVDGQRAAYAPRRHLLDQILVDAAVRAGARFRDGATVLDLLRDGDGAVCGVVYRDRDGVLRDARARLTVGADGMRSVVADRVDAPVTVQDPTSTCVYYAYWHDLAPRFTLYEAPGRFVGTIPTNNGETVVAAYFPQCEFDEVRRDVRKAYLLNIASTAPDLIDQASADVRFGKLYGCGDQRNFFRKAYGPGWVLVGDAGHHKDSITARGISDAFLQADLLSRTVLARLGDRESLADGMAEYERQRDDQLAESYYNTLSMARLELDDTRLTLLSRIAASRSLADRYFSVVSGAMSVEDVYSDELVGR